MSKEELVECEGEEHLRVGHVRSARGLRRKGRRQAGIAKRLISADLLLLAAVAGTPKD